MLILPQNKFTHTHIHIPGTPGLRCVDGASGKGLSDSRMVVSPAQTPHRRVVLAEKAEMMAVHHRSLALPLGQALHVAKTLIVWPGELP